jgi:group I intron endonuclease
MIYSVYAFIFSNKKIYIGITIRWVEIRKKEHIYCSRKKNPKYLVHKAIKKYGEESFEMIILATTNNEDELKMLEKKYIKEYNSYFENEIGYNMSLGGEGNFGYKFTDEIKIKMSQIRKEMYKNNPQYIEEWKQKIKKYWTNEKKQDMSDLKKEQHKNNPQIVEKWRKSRGEWSDEQKIEHSLIVKENFEKNPERAKQIS